MDQQKNADELKPTTEEVREIIGEKRSPLSRYLEELRKKVGRFLPDQKL